MFLKPQALHKSIYKPQTIFICFIQHHHEKERNIRRKIEKLEKPTDHIK